jgi:hypothetical protein
VYYKPEAGVGFDGCLPTAIPPMISSNVLQPLIAIGKSGDPDDTMTAAHLEAIGSFDWINREASSSWAEITREMPIDDMVALVKGLVLAEDYHRWIGGSVAAAIWVFRELVMRNPALADDVANWILPRTSNPWVPFGSQNHGARSVDEYSTVQQRRSECILAGLAEERASEHRAQMERLSRESQREQSARARYSNVRKQFIAELNILTIEAQLRRLATDEAHSVEFYPTRIADAANSEVINSLDEGTRILLWKKLKGKKRGPWKNFKKRLLSTFQSNPWNRKDWFLSKRSLPDTTAETGHSP